MCGEAAELPAAPSSGLAVFSPSSSGLENPDTRDGAFPRMTTTAAQEGWMIQLDSSLVSSHSSSPSWRLKPTLE